MTRKIKDNSRIFEAVRVGARDLHRLGFIDKHTMRMYDALCHEPVQDYDADKIKALRERLNLSQAVLASVLNTSVPPFASGKSATSVRAAPRRSCSTASIARDWSACFDIRRAVMPCDVVSHPLRTCRATSPAPPPARRACGSTG
jgi:DNA-binding transcriptional regulator YiaG